MYSATGIEDGLMTQRINTLHKRVMSEAAQLGWYLA